MAGKSCTTPGEPEQGAPRRFPTFPYDQPPLGGRDRGRGRGRGRRTEPRAPPPYLQPGRLSQSGVNCGADFRGAADGPGPPPPRRPRPPTEPDPCTGQARVCRRWTRTSDTRAEKKCESLEQNVKQTETVPSRLHYLHESKFSFVFVSSVF